MKKNRILESLCTLAATLLLSAGCSQNELGNEQGDSLPEGKYPIEFTATGLQATPLTRATVDGTWNGNEPIAIKIGDDVKEYVTEIYNERVPLKAVSEKFYYQIKGSFLVSAWYYGTGYNENPPKGWTVQSNQGTEENYQKSDFLYAYDTLGLIWGNGNLHFFHQTAKVVVHIIDGNQTPEGITVKSMTIGNGSNMYLTGSWTAPEKTWVNDQSIVLGAWTEQPQPGSIIPKKLGQQKVTVDNDEKTSLASYEALVIPQTIDAGEKLFVIDIDGYSPFYYKPEQNIEWQGGTQYTYNITLEGSTLSVTSISSSMDWGSGASGSGSVEIE